MIATNDCGYWGYDRTYSADWPASDGTTTEWYAIRTDIDAGAGTVECSGALRCMDLAERAAQIFEARMDQFSRLGAVIGDGVKYWRVRRVGPLGSQQNRPRRLFILAGYMSQSRGLAWDRRSRRGLK